jgi:hypothetical protein
MADEHYIIMTMECSRCKTKQKVHVAVHIGPTQMADETIQCLNCDNRFNVALPDKIIRGPFRRRLTITLPLRRVLCMVPPRPNRKKPHSNGQLTGFRPDWGLLRN